MVARTTPVARVLTEPCLILGVERPFAVANFTLAMVLVGELHLFAFLLVALGVHLVLRQATRRDAFTRRIYARYNVQGDRYEPWAGCAAVRVSPAAPGRPGAPC